VAKTTWTALDEQFRLLIKELRTSRGLTQADLAARLSRPQSYVSKYETGERRLDFVETALVCEALDMGIKEFASAFAARASKGYWSRVK
jgi:transcriptional regulator with XRE-family HTH domain